MKLESTVVIGVDYLDYFWGVTFKDNIFEVQVNSYMNFLFKGQISNLNDREGTRVPSHAYVNETTEIITKTPTSICSTTMFIKSCIHVAFQPPYSWRISSRKILLAIFGILKSFSHKPSLPLMKC